ncbi:uncharacterized protein LOC115211082 isoform X1 [Octopus sinensis]|uniref:Uncharacterized protein LOC115211082 isoform X1 n=1 Tax=Octopus sinensis TaxID=2607531 RepID=A0A7E6ERB5_9MOLL|nr:uncharacterized protein LOC115211082 isoform X1 [Octopus sinensis]
MCSSLIRCFLDKVLRLGCGTSPKQGRFQYYMILAFLLLLLSQLNYALYYANAKPKGNFPRLGKRNERLFKEHYNAILSSATFNDKLLHPKDIFSKKQQVYSIVENLDAHLRSRLLQSIRNRFLGKIKLD